ncbi:MAG: uroporphyrinogen-III synthase [Candidatus Caenarcaniphilales bacterium]|nr:uroporphyrinogen-III synthase [Candidatus Caenarcaniphilales bacterium]
MSSSKDIAVLLALPEHKIEKFRALLSSKLGARLKIFDFPILILKPLIEEIELDKSYLDKFDYLILTSSFGAEVFLERFSDLLPNSLKLVTVGPSVTKVIAKKQLKAHYQAHVYNSINLAKELNSLGVISENNFLIITGEKNNSQTLIEDIQANGGFVEKLIVYESVIPKQIDYCVLNNFLYSSSGLKIICLSSPEGVVNFQQVLKKSTFHNTYHWDGDSVQFVCLGPATEQKKQELFPNFATHCPQEYSYDGMIQEIRSLASFDV